jgi:hypothetical protein
MSSLSVNSTSSNSIYVATSVAQQRVAADRADVTENETQLEESKAQLDKDLTYLSTLQRKTQNVQQLERGHAQTNTMDRIAKGVQAAKQATQQALSALMSSAPTGSTLGTNIDVYA